MPRPSSARALLLAAALLAAPAAPRPISAQHVAPVDGPARLYTTLPVGEAEGAKWRADLFTLVTELERHHPNPYHTTPRDSLRAAAHRFGERIPALAAHEIVVGFARIVAMVGDGHTSINLSSAPGVDFHQLPVRFGVYRDGLWVEAADRAYADAVGARVVAFGGVPVDSALALVSRIHGQDNTQWRISSAPYLLNLVEVLHALGLSRSLSEATLTVEQEGRRRDVVLRPLAATRPRTVFPYRPRLTGAWVDARERAGSPAPLHQRRNDEVHWWEYVPAQRLLYIQFHQVQNRAPGATAFETFRAAMAFARENAARIDRVLLDLRNNTGGEGGLLDPIVREIVRTREVDEPGRFFVAISPRTFSAAVLFSSALERYSRATFVGEPTGGKPNVYAGHVFVTLPNSGVGVSISPRLYQTTHATDQRPSIVPRLAARPTFADYVAGRDPVLDAVLTWDGDRWVADFEAAVTRGDTATAERMLRAERDRPINALAPPTRPVNALGYRLVQAGNLEAALRVFRLNVRVHPEYTNGWDSLGEVYEQAGRGADAADAWERVQRLDSGNVRARDALARLRGRE